MLRRRSSSFASRTMHAADVESKFDAIISDPENQYWFQLRPGRLLSALCCFRKGGPALMTIVFDNWRVLHGRSAFTGKRRMCGMISFLELDALSVKLTRVLTFLVQEDTVRIGQLSVAHHLLITLAVNRDDFISKYRMTNMSEEEIRASTVTG